MDLQHPTEKEQREEDNAQGEDTTAVYRVLAESPALARSPDNSKNATAFTMFPKLPLEIQLRIWFFSLPGQRVVPLMLKQTVTNSDGFPRWLQFSYYRSPATIPSILHVCKQSRHEAKRHYQLTFAYEYNIHRSLPYGEFVPASPHIYFDPTIDVLFITIKGDRNGWISQNSEELANTFAAKPNFGRVIGGEIVRTLAVDVGVLLNLEACDQLMTRRGPTVFQQLETFVVTPYPRTNARLGELQLQMVDKNPDIAWTDRYRKGVVDAVLSPRKPELKHGIFLQ